MNTVASLEALGTVPSPMTLLLFAECILTSCFLGLSQSPFSRSGNLLRVTGPLEGSSWVLVDLEGQGPKYSLLFFLALLFSLALVSKSQLLNTQMASSTRDEIGIVSPNFNFCNFTVTPST